MLALCAADVEAVRADLGAPLRGEIRAAVLPTADLADWWQGRARFTSRKVHEGREPEFYGAVCESELGAVAAAVYWYHDWRRRQIALQRVIPAPLPLGSEEEETEAHVRALAALLLEALREARRWGIPKVLLWDPSPFTLRAVRLLADTLGIDVQSEERVRKGVPMIRWRGAHDTKNVTVCHHEFYARG